MLSLKSKIFSLLLLLAVAANMLALNGCGHHAPRNMTTVPQYSEWNLISLDGFSDLDRREEQKAVLVKRTKLLTHIDPQSGKIRWDSFSAGCSGFFVKMVKRRIIDGQGGYTLIEELAIVRPQMACYEAVEIEEELTPVYWSMEIEGAFGKIRNKTSQEQIVKNGILTWYQADGSKTAQFQFVRACEGPCYEESGHDNP